MRLFLRYLKGKRMGIAAFAGFGAVLAASFALYRLPLRAVLYPAALCAAAGIVLLVADFMRVRRRHLLLKDLSELEDGLPEPADIEAADYRAIAERLQEARRALEDRAGAERRPSPPCGCGCRTGTAPTPGRCFPSSCGWSAMWRWC